MVSAVVSGSAQRRTPVWVGWLVWAGMFAAVAAAQVAIDPECLSDRPPTVQDAAEVYDIAVSLGHGHGFAFDWAAPAFRQPWAARNVHGEGSDALAHDGPPHPTLARPPLVPLVLAVVLRLAPAHPFRAWRATDLALFAAAVTVLARAVARRYHWRAGLALAVVAAVDPLRAGFVPGWWTEGLAFDGVAVAAVIVLGAPRRSARALAVAGGLTMGWLCLGRSVFLIWAFVWPAVLAAAAGGTWRRRRTVVLGVLAVAVAVQVPWWARNVAVAGRFVPLGTQGGMNLPDEYSDTAVRYHGLWYDGLVMAQLWRDRQPAGPPSAAAMALVPRQPQYAVLMHAETCESTATELALADVGQRAGLAWIRSHRRALPWLFADKIGTESSRHHAWLAFLLIGGGVGLVLAPTGGRRPLWLLLALVVTQAVGIGLTHAVLGRFLVPGLPLLYVPAAVGMGEVVRRATRPTPAADWRP